MTRSTLLAFLLLLSNAPAQADDRADVAKVVDAIHDAAEKKDVARLESLHAYGPRFTKFEDDGLGRQDANAGKKGERDAFTGVKAVAMHIDDLKIDVFGVAAVATCLLRYSVDVGSEKIAGVDRATIVFVKDGGSWKIVHEHLSPFKAKP